MAQCIAVLIQESIRNMFKFDPVSNALRPSEVKMKTEKLDETVDTNNVNVQNRCSH